MLIITIMFSNLTVEIIYFDNLILSHCLPKHVWVSLVKYENNNSTMTTNQTFKVLNCSQILSSTFKIFISRGRPSAKTGFANAT